MLSLLSRDEIRAVCVVLYRRSGTNRDDHVDCGWVDVRMCDVADLCAMRRALVESRMFAQKVGNSDAAAARMTYKMHNVLVRRKEM